MVGGGSGEKKYKIPVIFPIPTKPHVFPNSLVN